MSDLGEQIEQESDPQPVGQIIDALGVTLHLSNTDMVTDVVVITKVLEGDGTVRLATGWSEGMSWIERLGMVTAVKALEMPSPADIQCAGDD